MKFIQISVITNRAGEDLVADVMFSAGATGVSIYDTADVLELYKGQILWDYIDEAALVQSEQVTVNGFLPEDDEVLNSVKRGLEELNANRQFDIGSLEYKLEKVDEEEWLTVWKKFYSVIDFGKVAVVPSWIEYTPRDGQVAVRIEPKTAFGTGEHETTGLCIEELADSDLSGKRVIDIGTGSGILAITALKLGAESVLAGDIDLAAVGCAKENAALNDVGDNLTVVCGDLLQIGGTDGDVIVANITADILIRLAGDIHTVLKKGSKVILSGIIHTRLADVRNAYEAVGLTFVRHRVRGEWNLLVFQA